MLGSISAVWPQAATPTRVVHSAWSLSAAWAARTGAGSPVCSSAWAGLVPFLPFDTEIRRTNTIEPVNARVQKAVRAREYFPNEAAALKCVSMGVMSFGPTGRNGWTMRWKPATQVLDIAFDGRLPIGRC
ncbi:transposase [Streptomyces murinus]|uniref:transposase n=1 Tax=Streptomyces murinus TaxID=33900 RepID=UPI0038152E12